MSSKLAYSCFSRQGGKTIFTLDLFEADKLKENMLVMCFDKKRAESFKQKYDGYKGLKMQVEEYTERQPNLTTIFIDEIEQPKVDYIENTWHFVRVTK